MLPPRVGEHARRIVVHDLDVGHERRARVESLEQIVRQQRVLRHAPLERRRERIDVVQSLAGEDAFAEQILVDVGDGGRVRIDAGVAGVGAREERPRRARHRHADARLQDAVALGDASRLRVEPRLVQRVRDDADEALGGIARQTRVGVERDAVADRRQHVEVADLRREARVGGAAQQAVELFDLAALPLPADPRLLARVPLPVAVKQEEAVGVLGAELEIERLDARARALEDRRVLGRVDRVRCRRSR